MQPLEKSLRNKLEATVQQAREEAEAAARAALEQLGVAEAAPYAHLGDAERELRRKLRAHGRQLGDSLNGGSVQSMDRLVEETAYEHWHRMLFARFLAENSLLIYEGVAISLEECEELAAEEGMPNGWQLAAQLASRMLPQIFRPDSPVFQLAFPTERQQRLERLLAGLAPEVFTASDSLGWVYQFWQARRKDEINKAEVKIGARELPAVTQLFTEPYMVAFLLDNSLGAWWAMRRLSADDWRNAADEDELRRKAAIPGVPLEYLRFVKGEDGAWRPAAGTFEKWPDELGKLTTLDPCCGSGHFLVAALLMLAPMRMEREGLSARDAVDAVLRENLHGLELDRRCVELAAFALALTAWRYPEAGGYRPLPELHLACSGLSVGAAKEEWKQLALGKQNLRLALEWMHDAFRDAPTLGSLLNPARTEASRVIPWEELSQTLADALAREQSDEQREAGVVAQGLAKAATLLARQYQWVITNVPYLSRGKQGETLRNFIERYYPAGKPDLATAFLERCLEFCRKGGTTSLVLPQNWLFLSSYRKLRERLLQRETWQLIARLGEGGFESSAAAGAFTILITLSRGNEAAAAVGKADGLFTAEGSAARLSGLDVSGGRTAVEKAEGLRGAEVLLVKQAKQLANPDARITFVEKKSAPILNEYAYHNLGICSGDSIRFYRNIWEFPMRLGGWSYMQGTVESTQFYGGCEQLIKWEKGTGALYDYVVKKLGKEQVGSWLRGRNAWGKKGVLVSAMRNLPVTYYQGGLFDENAVVLICDDKYLIQVWASCSDISFNTEVRSINQTLKVRGDLVKIPFDIEYWSRVAKERYPHGFPTPYSNDPTQWLFHGHPCGSVVFNETSRKLEHGPLRTDQAVLQVAVARLLGYRWPAESDREMELSEESREWIDRAAALDALADEDGILCLPAVRGEDSAADRLLGMLVAAYGEAWSSQTLGALLKAADHEGKSLETWLRDKFFAQHCNLFHHRPFIWHIWDGLRDGFAALVNYHKLDRKNLETLIYTYLGDWMTRQKQEQANGVDGAEERLAAAEALKKRLELILAGEAPYDIFVRWKPIEEQPIGWEPDLNDGVRLNIRPFMSVLDVGKKGAGVLRDKPNIKWEKDRGKDVETAPWYKVFGGDRINDHHLKIAEKQAARKESQGKR